MATPRTDSSGLPAGAPPPTNWQSQTPMPSSSGGGSVTLADLQSKYGGGYTLAGAGGSGDAVWGVPADKMNLPVLWGRGGTVLAGGESRGPGIDIPHSYRLDTFADTTKTYVESLREFYNFDSDQLKMIQTAMYGLGMLPKNWNPGLLGNNNDPDSISGWKTVVQTALQSDKTIWEVLQGGLAAAAKGGGGGGRGGGGRQRAPLQIRYSSPDDLKAAARAAAQDTLGYVPQDDFLDDFVKLYHGLEAGAQRKAYAGGNYTDPGNAQVKAAAVAKKEHKTEAEGYAIVKQFDALLGILGVEQ